MKSWTFAAPAPHQPPAPAPAVVDAVPCTHHPNHAAIAVCDATGDYICSLCAVGIGPHTIGANHLTLDDTQHWLNNRVSRPDRQLASAFGLSFLSLFVCSAIPAPFLYIWGWVAFAQHLKLSRTPGLYAATHTRSTTAKLSIIMLTWTILLAAMGFIFTFAFIG